MLKQKLNKAKLWLNTNEKTVKQALNTRLALPLISSHTDSRPEVSMAMLFWASWVRALMLTNSERMKNMVKHNFSEITWLHKTCQLQSILLTLTYVQNTIMLEDDIVLLVGRHSFKQYYSITFICLLVRNHRNLNVKS